MKIGFDLDRVFIDYPPLVPSFIIDWLYKHSWKELFFPKKPLQSLSYRIPKVKSEIVFRQLSHFWIFRPPILPNIQFLKELSQANKKNSFYLISSRYNFLEKISYNLLKKYQLDQYFSSINLNTQNIQPHLFKESKIKQLGIDIYVDDDLALLKHLKKTCPDLKLFWLCHNGYLKNTDGIPVIRQLSDLKNYLLP